MYEHPSPVHHRPEGHILKNAPAHIKSVFSALKLSRSHTARHSLSEQPAEGHSGLIEPSEPLLAPHESEHFAPDQAQDNSNSERSDLEIHSSEDKTSEPVSECHSPENHDSKQLASEDSEPEQSAFETHSSKDKASGPVSEYHSPENHDSKQLTTEDSEPKQSAFEIHSSKDKASEPMSEHDSKEDNEPEQVSQEDSDPEQHASEVLSSGHKASDSTSEPHCLGEHGSKESVQEESDTEQPASEEPVPKQDISDQPVQEQSVLEEPETPFETTQLENNKKAMDVFRGAKRYLRLNELILAQENIDEALSTDTMDDDNYNRADAYFLAMQICRRAKEYSMALDYIEEGIKSVNPYRGDGPKFVLAKGVILLQTAELEHSASKREKHMDAAIESFKMAVSVSDVLLSRKSKYHFDESEVLTIKKYQQMAIFNLAYAHDITGHRRESIASLDRLFEMYPHFRVEKTPFELYNKILAEKKKLHIAK